MNPVTVLTVMAVALAALLVGLLVMLGFELANGVSVGFYW